MVAKPMKGGTGKNDRKLTFTIKNKKIKTKNVDMSKKDGYIRNKWSRFANKKEAVQDMPSNEEVQTPKIIKYIDESFDYDVAICIPSFNRYEKLTRLIYQFLTQETKYRFKIIVLDDGSDDERYFSLSKDYNVFYLKNPAPNGKAKHWVCYSQMWGMIRNDKCRFVLQLDDDFILCDNFLDTLIDTFIQKNFENPNIIGVAPHSWSFDAREFIGNEPWWDNPQLIDGIGLFDISVIKDMNYTLNYVTPRVAHTGVSVKVWSQFTNYAVVNKKHYYRTEKSLVYHDGNLDPKLHPNFREIKQIHTKKLHPSLLKYKIND